jgi:hypothetical protein
MTTASELRALALDDDLVERVRDRLGPRPFPGATPHKGVGAEVIRQVLAALAEEFDDAEAAS